ncbi:hypothetical protein POM88_027739 [Heracleum sosnowskyi]|uniref:Uncharacterized protein n=1 Tax=Heracleum sosnowskyi TaxID=360622 RepID=A0AAD8IBK7_9APIA|nr:hypothetical protein POM88_027739 [Heracleum sosnowskyi]
MVGGLRITRQFEVSSHFGVFNNHSAFILNKSQINLTYLQALNIMVWIKLQSTLNHVWMSGLLGDGFGAAYGMMRNVIVWVLSRMHLQEDHHPICLEVQKTQQFPREVPRD